MQKILFLIRHAKAEEYRDDLDDFDRKLNHKGLSQAETMGKMLKSMGIKPDKLYVSPAKRTTQTAQIIAEILGCSNESLIFDSSIYEAGTQSLLDVINGFDKNAKSVFLVGHNPGISTIADYLTNGSVGSLPTCGMVEISFDAEHWEHISQNWGTLGWFKSPQNN